VDGNIVKNNIQKINAIFSVNPHLTFVFAFPQSRKYIGSGFLRFDQDEQLSVEKISVTGKNLESIGNSFCLDQNKITSVDLRCLTNLKNIGHLFLAGTGITSLDLRGQTRVQTIGRRFLCGAPLKDINLEPLSNVTHVGEYFLSRTPLRELNIGVMVNLDIVEPNFISNMPYLELLILGIRPGSHPSIGSYKYICDNPSLKHIVTLSQRVYEFIRAIFNDSVTVELAIG
ncbi:MAG: hypothetical protein Q8K36_01480, partial [Alphaproteobacteria bacterium]|nr:hypothetical protein [Alphaproteobacteria bacterium]